MVRCGLRALKHRVQKSEQGSVPIEQSDVEQQLASLEREEERAKRGHFFQPRRQVGGHDDDRILQLPVHLRRQLGVDELALFDDRSAKMLTILKSSYDFRGIKLALPFRQCKLVI